MAKGLSRTSSTPELARITASEAEAAARAAPRLFKRWQIPDAAARKILGGLGADTYAHWKVGKIGRIGPHRAARLSLLMGIHTGLRLFFKDPERGYAWVTKPNEAFGGKSPVEVMAHRDMSGLAHVHGYLIAERNRW